MKVDQKEEIMDKSVTRLVTAICIYTSSVIALAWGSGSAFGQDRLPYPQRQAMKRVESRYREMQSLFKDNHSKYEAEKVKLKGRIVPPSH